MRLGVWLAALALAFTASTDANAAAPKLKRFSSCAQLLTYARHGARRTGGGVGVLPQALPPGVETIAAPQRSEGAAPVAAPAPATPDFSVQAVEQRRDRWFSESTNCSVS